MNITTKTINYLKAISAETIANAKSGHTGVTLGASSILFALFKDHYNFDVSDTDYVNRDRFVLSAGHASALYYTLLSMFGFDVSLQDLKEFRTYKSKTPGHPEYGVTDGVEASTGPLGQGVANAVGMAIAESVMEERFNTVGFEIFNHYTYAFVGDGCLMEGVAQEAVSLAGTLKLNKLILLYDSNEVTIDGPVQISNQENIAKKFRAMGWNVITVERGNSYKACSHAIGRAKKSSSPSIIIFKTTIGIGTDKEGTSAIHGTPLSAQELKIFKAKLKVKDGFFIPNDVREFCMASTRRGKLEHEKWNQQLAMYSSTHPELYKSFMSFFDKRKINYERIVRNISKYDGQSLRKINHYALNELAYQCPQLLGGTADVATSVQSIIDNAGRFSSRYRRGKNIYYGIREHAMGSISNGIALYDDFITFDSTFLSFSNYMMPSIRMRSVMKLPVMSFFTHDSIYVGEDGPSHQPIEQIGQLRAVIGNTVYRPCDYRELVAGYEYAIKNRTPVSFILTRQNMPSVMTASYDGALMGGYTIYETDKPKVVLVASGSEVSLCIDTAKELQKKFNTSVVSMPSLEIYDKQQAAYKSKLFPKDALIVYVELSNDTKPLAILPRGAYLYNLNDYQYSGKGSVVVDKAGFNVRSVAKFVESKLKKQN